MQNKPDNQLVVQAAQHAESLIRKELASLPQATKYAYGGHDMVVTDYKSCQNCTLAIAEAQQAYLAIYALAHDSDDQLVKQHLDLAASLLEAEAEIARMRAMLHGGKASEGILNALLEFIHDRNIHDSYEHSHHKGEQ